MASDTRSTGPDLRQTCNTGSQRTHCPLDRARRQSPIKQHGRHPARCPGSHRRRQSDNLGLDCRSSAPHVLNAMGILEHVTDIDIASKSLGPRWMSERWEIPNALIGGPYYEGILLFGVLITRESYYLGVYIGDPFFPYTPTCLDMS